VAAQQGSTPAIDAARSSGGVAFGDSASFTPNWGKSGRDDGCEVHISVCGTNLRSRLPKARSSGVHLGLCVCLVDGSSGATNDRINSALASDGQMVDRPVTADLLDPDKQAGTPGCM